MHDDQVNFTAIEFYPSGRPRYYITHDPITDEKTLIERRDEEGSPLHATGEILNGFLHGKVEIYNAKSNRVCQDALYNQGQLITENIYTHKKTDHLDENGIKKKKRKILISRTHYNHPEQQAVEIRVCDEPRQGGLLTFKKTLFDLTDGSTIAQEKHAGLIINNNFFAVRNKTCPEDKTPSLMWLGA